MMALLRKREELVKNGGEDLISKYRLHYCDNDDRAILSLLNLEQRNAHWDNVADFEKFLEKNVGSYLGRGNFCPLAVCVMLRRWIEKYCYEKLGENKKADFIKKYGTRNKLSFVRANGIVYPEIFDLLEVIYNDPLHETDKKDLRQILYSRLQHNTIRAMIEKVKDLCTKIKR